MREGCGSSMSGGWFFHEKRCFREVKKILEGVRKFFCSGSKFLFSGWGGRDCFSPNTKNHGFQNFFDFLLVAVKKRIFLEGSAGKEFEAGVFENPRILNTKKSDVFGKRKERKIVLRKIRKIVRTSHELTVEIVGKKSQVGKKVSVLKIEVLGRST